MPVLFNYFVFKCHFVLWKLCINVSENKRKRWTRMTVKVESWCFVKFKSTTIVSGTKQSLIVRTPPTFLIKNSYDMFCNLLQNFFAEDYYCEKENAHCACRQRQSSKRKMFAKMLSHWSDCLIVVIRQTADFHSWPKLDQHLNISASNFWIVLSVCEEDKFVSSTLDSTPLTQTTTYFRYSF